MKANAQKAAPFLIGLLVALVGTAAAAELRTWTFSQDGQMKSSSGGITSFKKKGRLDAAFVRAETNNIDVLLMAARGEYLTIAITNLSDTDRDYVDRAVKLDRPDVSLSQVSAIERNELSRRKVEAAKVREDAIGKRRLAQSELDEADKLDAEAARLSARASELHSQANATEKCAEPVGIVADSSSPSKACEGKLKGAAAIASGAAKQFEEDAARIQLQATEKRQKAEALQRQAAQLEQTAGLLETNPPATAPVPANTGANGSKSGPADKRQNPNS